ncbi:hypothetical protein [Kutzneria sp. NPDC051319]
MIGVADVRDAFADRCPWQQEVALWQQPFGHDDRHMELPESGTRGGF